jgi:hypothetical protein
MQCMKFFLLLLVLLGAIHSMASASIVPGLLTALSGSLLAVMALLDSRGQHGEDAMAVLRRARRPWPYHASPTPRTLRNQISMR